MYLQNAISIAWVSNSFPLQYVYTLTADCQAMWKQFNFYWLENEKTNFIKPSNTIRPLTYSISFTHFNLPHLLEIFNSSSYARSYFLTQV